MSKKSIPLAHVPREIKREHGGNVTYRSVYNGVLDGTIAAEQTNGRWYVKPGDLPAIAEKLRKQQRDRA